MKENKRKRNISSLGQYVRDWKEGMKIDNEELIQFALQEKIDLNSIVSKRDIQSLVSKRLYSSFSFEKKKAEKEQKEKKETQEIDDSPPEEQEEQDEAHGGDEDQHQDIEDVEDEENQGRKEKDSQENQNNNSDSNSKSNSKSQEDQKQTSNTNSNSFEQKARQTAQKNKKSNETLRKQLKQLEQEYGDIDNEGKKSEVHLSQNTSRKVGYGGGGCRMDDAKALDIATFRAIQDFLTKLASDDSPVGKEEGKSKWDPVKIVKSRFNADFVNAKFSRPKERNIWFIVDDSGSVSQFAEFIMSMIQGASNVVNVAHGSEAKPCNLIKLPKVNTPKVLRLRNLGSFTTWEQEFNHSFIKCLNTFIKECEVQNGDVLVFWGDLMDALESSYDTSESFRRILRKYKCYWLLSHDGDSSYRGNHTEIIEESRVFKMFYNINNAKALRKAITKIK
jgi:hypothetical protein